MWRARGVAAQAARGSAAALARRLAPLPLAVASTGGLLALAWTAFKVGALSYGGGFVIVPLMQGDAVDRFHWMTDRSFSTRSRSGRSRPAQ